MTKEIRILALEKLGKWMQNLDAESKSFLESLSFKNPWYTYDNVIKQFHVIGSSLSIENLTQWVSPYQAVDNSKTVGLILAGNLPLVGFHDILVTLIMGFNAQIKVSSDDAGLTSFVLTRLIQIEPDFNQKIQIVETLSNFDLVIATGSNNTARYFEYYFGKKPNVIRKNRNSIAILHGDESKEELTKLGSDIFDYFGMGCRSVSKLFIPQDFEISRFFEAVEEFKDVANHYKYNNNYDYNKSIYLINGDKHYDNGFLLLKEDKNNTSPLAVVFYERYDDISKVESEMNTIKDQIQCIVSSKPLALDIPTFPLGQSQCPSLSDYADGINTLEFLDKNQ